MHLVGTDEHEGCRDCGTFFLDVVGQFAPADLHVRWVDQPTRAINEKLEPVIEETWLKETDRAAQTGRRLFNGRLCRLAQSRPAGRSLDLTLCPVSFKEFVGTNLTHAFMRYVHGPEVLANPLGVSAAVLTRDGFILMGRRSGRVMYHPNRIHPIGGMVEPGDNGPPDPFKTMSQEIFEETNTPPEAISIPLCLGLVRDKHIVQPELVFKALVDADFSDIVSFAASARDAHEHAEFVPVRNHPSAVVSFIEQNFAALTPLGIAMLLLHGQHAWGSGWFAATRGYLRSVI